MKRSILTIAAVFVTTIFALCGVPTLARAATGDSVYVEVDEPTSGETYVFHANISNNLEKSDTEDRLLTADTFIPVNRQGTSTTAFSFDDSDNLWANGNNLDQYEFEVTAVQGDTDEGNQGYQIRMTGKNVDDAQYLAVTQTVVETVRNALDTLTISPTGNQRSSMAWCTRRFPSYISRALPARGTGMTRRENSTRAIRATSHVPGPI